MITESVLSLFGLGFVSAGILSVASKFLAVEEDPRIEVVAEALPGANCGGCGFAGCESYAAAVINDPNVAPNKCCAGGPDVAARVAELTGKAAGAADPMVAFRRCVKVEGNVAKKFEYFGIKSCAAAKLIQDGPDTCKFSCLGFGDCVRACPFDAMWVENGLVHIAPAKCTSCGTCVRTCPNAILELIPRRSRVMVFCSSQDKGKAVKDVCDAGCISCGACIKKCPAQAITMVDERIHIDHKACLAYGPSCGEACVEKCPRNILRCLNPEYIAEAPEKEPAKYPEESHVADLKA
ncbi:MAG: Fe-S cluster domain-containing protein [Desulfovibrionales bacterium]|nr:Fe-S cluster domain-containing protein [Desulfovibrionales bacterium]